MAGPQETTFKAAFPYGVGALAIGAVGAAVAVAATVTAIKILGISAAIIGAYGFFSVLICGILHADEPGKFREELPKFAGMVIGSAVADIISRIAIAVIGNLIFGRENTVRVSHF